MNLFLQVSKVDHQNFKDLVWDLIFSKEITNEIEKVRYGPLVHYTIDSFAANVAYRRHGCLAS